MDLEFAWNALERAALWAASTDVDAPDARRSLATTTCQMLLPAQASHLRGVAALGRADIDHVPTAMAAARGVFELGLRAAWVFVPDEEAARDLRAAALHQASAEWRGKVGRRLHDSVGSDDARWRAAAESQHAFVTRHLPPGFAFGDVPKLPSTYDQLRALGLERLYHGFQIASEYVHGGLALGGELAAVRDESSPYGLYWPQDWSLACNMCAWGCLFISQHTNPKSNVVPIPIGELMSAADALYGAPGPP